MIPRVFGYRIEVDISFEGIKYIDAIDVTDLLGEGLHCENLKF